MITNTDLTILNRYPDRQSKKMVYVPHYIDAVWFHTDQKTDIVDGGLTSKDVYKIRIPYEKCEKWLPENGFKAQESTGKLDGTERRSVHGWKMDRRSGQQNRGIEKTG